MNNDLVILVDEHDREIGLLDKLVAHINGTLHRAFSVIIYNSKNEILLQKRASTKYHSAGLWTNSCCSHPKPNCSILETAQERLLYEMGIQCELKIINKFIYQCKLDDDMIEHELDYICIGYSDEIPQPNPNEVQQWKWESIEFLENDIKHNPSQYTFWFREIIQQNLLKKD